MAIRFLALPLFMFAVTATAEIIDLGTVTYDTESGLSWLDATETLDMSYNEVVSEMAEGGSLHGWRHATTYEFDQLMSHFGMLPLTSNCTHGVAYCDRGRVWDEELLEHIILTLGDTLVTHVELDHPQSHIEPEGAGASNAVLVHGVEPRILREDSTEPPQLVLDQISDGEIHFWGWEPKDSPDELKTIDRYFIGSAKSIIIGHRLVKCEWATAPANPYFCLRGLRIEPVLYPVAEGVVYWHDGTELPMVLIRQEHEYNIDESIYNDKNKFDSKPPLPDPIYLWEFQSAKGKWLSPSFDNKDQALKYLDEQGYSYKF